MKRRFQVYDALLYRSQVVAGVNYIIKVSDILFACALHPQGYGYMYSRKVIISDIIQLLPRAITYTT